MDEQTTSTGVSPDPVAVSPISTRVVNVFSAPSELYNEVAVAPVQSSSWVIPLIISILLAVLAVFIIYNNTMLRQQVMDLQQEGMKKAVAEGKMTQQQFDQAAGMMESSGGALFMVIGGIGAGVSMVIMFFGGSLVLWLVARYGLKFTGTYKKMLEVFGLTWFIGILGSVITLIMMNYFGSMYAIPAPSALISSLDTSGYGYRLLSSLNIFTLWQVIVLGFGISKMTGKSNGAGMGVAFGCWLLFVLIEVAFGWGMK
jgi:hypothetical protein